MLHHRSVRIKSWECQAKTALTGMWSALPRDVEHTMAPPVLMTVSPIKFAVRRETKWEQSIRRTGLLLALSTRPRTLLPTAKASEPGNLPSHENTWQTQNTVTTLFDLLMPKTVACEPGRSVSVVSRLPARRQKNSGFSSQWGRIFFYLLLSPLPPLGTNGSPVSLPGLLSGCW